MDSQFMWSIEVDNTSGDQTTRTPPGTRSPLRSGHATPGLAERTANLESAFEDLVDKCRRSEASQCKFDELQERVAHIECTLGEKHAKLESTQAQLGKCLEFCDAHGTELQRRVDHFESLLKDTIDKSSKLEVAHTALLKNQQKDLHQLSSLEQQLVDSAQKYALVEEFFARHASAQEDHESLTAQQSALLERLDYLEQAISDSAENHAKWEVAQSTNRKFHEMEWDLQERIGHLEKMCRSASDKHAKLEVVQASISSLQEEQIIGSAQRAALQERMGCLEGMCRDSSETRSQAQVAAAAYSELQAQQIALQHRVVHVEGAVADVTNEHAKWEDLYTTMTKLTKDHDALGNQRAAFQHRVEYLESVIGDCADKSSRAEAKARKDHLQWEERHASLHDRVACMEQLHSASLEKHAKLETRLAEQACRHRDHEDWIAHHACVLQRLDDLEKAASDSATKHASCAADIAKVHRARDVDHSAMQERVACAENLIRDSVEKVTALSETLIRHAQDYEAHVENYRGLVKHVAYLEEMCEASADGVSKSDAAHAALHRHVAQLEAALGDSADKHSRWESSQAILTRLQKDTSAHAAQHVGLQDRVGLLEKLVGETELSLAQHAKAYRDQQISLRDKVAHVEALVDSSKDKHDRLEATLGKYATAYRQYESLAAQQSSWQHRVDGLEKAVGASVEKSGLWEAYQVRMNQVEQACKVFADKNSANNQEFGTRHAALQEKVEHLQRFAKSAATKHAQLEEAHTALVKLHEAATAAQGANDVSLWDRLRVVETNAVQSAEAMHARWVKLQKEHEARASHHVELHERMKCIEASFEDTTKRHSKVELAREELQVLRQDHAVHGMRNADLQARVDVLESRLGETVEKAAQWDDAHAQVVRLQSLQEGKTSNIAVLERKVQQLESAMCSAGDQYAKLGSACSTLSKSVKDCGARVEHAAWLEERVMSLERTVLGDPAGASPSKTQVAHGVLGRATRRYPHWHDPASSAR